jgi:hypothetical protein
MNNEQQWTVEVVGPSQRVPLLSWRCDTDTALGVFLHIADKLNTTADAPVALIDGTGREVITYDNRTQPKGNPCHN